MTHSGGGSEEFYSVQGAGRDQLMDNSRIGWYQGEVLSIINLLVSTSPGSMFLWSAVFIWRGSAPCKNNLGMCQAFIDIFQGTGSLVILPCGRLRVSVVTSSPAQQLFFVSPSSSHFSIINSRVSLLLQKTRTQGLVHGFTAKGATFTLRNASALL